MLKGENKPAKGVVSDQRVRCQVGWAGRPLKGREGELFVFWKSSGCEICRCNTACIVGKEKRCCPSGQDMVLKGPCRAPGRPRE